MLEETRDSFNCLFPRLRPGGIYVIEDWAWSHIPSSNVEQGVFGESELTRLLGSCNVIQENFRDKSTLANLIIEIMLASVAVPSVIDELVVNDGFVIVRRGVAELLGEFNVSQHGFHFDLKTERKNFFL